MNLAISPGGMKKTVSVPGSKSYANRALILAALKSEDVLLRHMPKASDVKHLITALSQLGLKLTSEGDSLRVSGSFPACESTDMTLSVGEGGTTARFLAVLLLKGQRKYQLKLGSRLKERPWQEFIEAATSLGAKAEIVSDTLTIQGPLKEGSLMVDCSRTTQFYTGFQLVFSKDRKVEACNLESSQSYVRMTEKMLKEFEQDSVYDVPLDLSSASYPLAFAALNQGAEFPGLAEDPFQADSKFIEILNDEGLINKTAHGLSVSSLNHNFSLEKDVSDCLDLVPTLAFFLAHVSGTHVLKGVRNLRHKESDRLEECLKLLKIFGREAQEKEDCLVIEGHTSKLSLPQKLHLPDDHRMVMSAALFLRHHAGGSLEPAEAVEKSYPNFFELFDGPR